MSTASSILESVETELLGRRGVSFKIAAKKTGWEPESREHVCWRCAGSIGPFESDGDGCASCRESKLPWSRAIRLGKHEGILRDAVLDLKFRRWRQTGLQVGEALGTLINERIEEMGIEPAEVRLVPIPITHRRRIRRGVDHTFVLSRGISRGCGIRISRLLRARKRLEQIGLSATDRTKNMRGGFFVPDRVQKSLKKGSLDEIRVFILVDDVRTTGATLEEGCRAINRVFSSLRAVDGREIWVASVGVAGETRKECSAGV